MERGSHQQQRERRDCRLAEEISSGTLDGHQWWQSIHGLSGEPETGG
jgi:hypothetical protein